MIKMIKPGCYRIKCTVRNYTTEQKTYYGISLEEAKRIEQQLLKELKLRRKKHQNKLSFILKTEKNKKRPSRSKILEAGLGHLLPGIKK